MKIETLKDLKKALNKIPEDILDKYGVGYNQEGDGETLLLRTGEDEEDIIGLFCKETKKYKSLDLIDKWIKKITELAENSYNQTTEQDENDYEPFMSVSTDKVKKKK